mgnify:CR=1 FL=1
MALVAIAAGTYFLAHPLETIAAGAKLFTFKEEPVEYSAAHRTSPAAVREARLHIDKAARSLMAQKKIEIPLFDGKLHTAVRTEMEDRGEDGAAWRGKFENSEDDVVITFHKGRLAGLIYNGKTVYELVPKGNEHILMEIDQDLFPSCGGAPAAEPEPAANAFKAAGNAVDSGDRIDVLIVYTAAVKNSLGGTAQAQTFAQQSIDSTNTTYLNSKIRQRVRLAAAVETSIVELGTLGAELSAIRADAAINALREEHKADLVALISNSVDNCGIGYLMNSATGNQGSGFTVSSRTCAVGNLTFAHELGHNMGSHHNPENGGTTIYPFAFGHYINGVYRTVMSYTNPCTAGCPKRPYFSNPAISSGGYPTGILNERDNARSINLTADVVASYRYSGSSITLQNFNGGNGAGLPRMVQRAVQWSSDGIGGSVKIELSRDEGTTWETLVASTPNDGSESVRIYGRPTRTGRIRISSVTTPFVTDSSISNVPIK